MSCSQHQSIGQWHRSLYPKVHVYYFNISSFQSWVTSPVYMTPISSMLVVFASKNNQVVQIWIWVSHVEAVSTQVKFDVDPWVNVDPVPCRHMASLGRNGSLIVAKWHQSPGSSLVQIMACRLFSTMSEPMLTNYTAYIRQQCRLQGLKWVPVIIQQNE